MTLNMPEGFSMRSSKLLRQPVEGRKRTRYFTFNYIQVMYGWMNVYGIHENTLHILIIIFH